MNEYSNRGKARRKMRLLLTFFCAVLSLGVIYALVQSFVAGGDELQEVTAVRDGMAEDELQPMVPGPSQSTAPTAPPDSPDASPDVGHLPVRAEVAAPEVSATNQAERIFAPVPSAAPESQARTEPPAAALPAPVVPGRAGLVERGDTVASLLHPYLAAYEIDALTKACAKVFPLTRIRDDRRYEIAFPSGVFTFEYEINAEEKLVVHKTGAGFAATKQIQKYEVVLDRVEGTIVSSLFQAVEGKGERAELAIALADIFAWEVDFIRDIRVGDSYKIVVEKRYREGRFMGYGRILAAEFVNQGDVYQGFLFTDADGRPGYFDDQGMNLRKAFLRAPLKFTRISSVFSKSRMHPVLNIVRPHFGVDYAAPSGTPVKTVGEGVVVSAGWRSGGGKTVHIKHSNGYETMYMHLSGFPSGLKAGRRVSQGELIGFVGATGLATGPHLDFRVEKDGKFINPAKLDNPRAQSLPAALMPAFRDKVATERERLERPGFAQERPSSAAPRLRDGATL